MCHLYARELLNEKHFCEDEASGVAVHEDSSLTDTATPSTHELHVNTSMCCSSRQQAAAANENVADELPCLPQTKRLVGIATVFVKSHDSDNSAKAQQQQQQQQLSSLHHHESSSTELLSVTVPNVKPPDDVTLPDGYARIVKYLPSAASEHDEQCLLRTCQELEYCLFYIAQLTSAEAKNRLKATDVGTFLLRDSSHTNYLFALTVKTCRGVTSIRIKYSAEGFQLDTNVQQLQLMPAFNTVLQLVSYYVRKCQQHNARHTVHSSHSRPTSCGIYLDRSGKENVPVVLKTPYQGRLTSLKQLCRLAVNKQLDGRSLERLALSPTLKQFMQLYKFQF